MTDVVREIEEKKRSAVIVMESGETFWITRSQLREREPITVGQELDVEELKRAQLEPENYKDLIVRLWGVSAHFVDLPRELQDEMIARFS